MADIYNSVWLYANSLGPDQRGSTYTLMVPRRNVFAHMSLTAFVPATTTQNLVVGCGAGTLIVRYSYFETENRVIEVSTPPDLNRNSIRIYNCASITFALSVKSAWAYA